MSESQKEYFESAAVKYNSNAVLVPGASRFRNLIIDKAMRKSLLPILKDLHGLFILEVGCGVGRWTEKMADENSVVGVDMSSSMLKLTMSKCRGKQCSFVVADASYLPFKEGVFDLVISVTVLQHILDGKRHLKALSDIAYCGKSKTILVEEMWSDKEIILKNVYCPIRVIPVESYVEALLKNHVQTDKVSGLTLAPIAIIFTDFLASKAVTSEGTINSGVRSSNLLSGMVHFVMALGTISSLLSLNRYHNPRFSIHTILIAKKVNLEAQLWR